MLKWLDERENELLIISHPGSCWVNQNLQGDVLKANLVI
jgi:hypothetical protein